VDDAVPGAGRASLGDELGQRASTDTARAQARDARRIHPVGSSPCPGWGAACPSCIRGGLVPVAAPSRMAATQVRFRCGPRICGREWDRDFLARRRGLPALPNPRRSADTAVRLAGGGARDPHARARAERRPHSAGRRTSPSPPSSPGGRARHARVFSRLCRRDGDPYGGRSRRTGLGRVREWRTAARGAEERRNPCPPGRRGGPERSGRGRQSHPGLDPEGAISSGRPQRHHPPPPHTGRWAVVQYDERRVPDSRHPVREPSEWPHPTSGGPDLSGVLVAAVAPDGDGGQSQRPDFDGRLGAGCRRAHGRVLLHRPRAHPSRTASLRDSSQAA